MLLDNLKNSFKSVRAQSLMTFAKVMGTQEQLKKTNIQRFEQDFKQKDLSKLIEYIQSGQGFNRKINLRPYGLTGNDVKHIIEKANLLQYAYKYINDTIEDYYSISISPNKHSIEISGAHNYVNGKGFCEIPNGIMHLG